jgi:hypothetical protein
VESTLGLVLFAARDPRKDVPPGDAKGEVLVHNVESPFTRIGDGVLAVARDMGRGPGPNPVNLRPPASGGNIARQA